MKAGEVGAHRWRSLIPNQDRFPFWESSASQIVFPHDRQTNTNARPDYRTVGIRSQGGNAAKGPGVSATGRRPENSFCKTRRPRLIQWNKASAPADESSRRLKWNNRGASARPFFASLKKPFCKIFTHRVYFQVSLCCQADSKRHWGAVKPINVQKIQRMLIPHNRRSYSAGRM
jgi:hypothetical protein